MAARKPDFWVQAIMGAAFGLSAMAWAYKESKGGAKKDFVRLHEEAERRKLQQQQQQQQPQYSQQGSYDTPQWMPQQQQQQQGAYPTYQDPYSNNVYSEPVLNDGARNWEDKTGEVWLDDGDEKWARKPTSSGWN
eukprot:TRINITY_DN408_c0_g1_i1.p1 TRINITY_DN408_c0_g1~~TRINITY_DN408_c0_g1_i1.p1  ORF type:complete len:135 (-),score=44.93 TRINITY_DN408_c0_g1_i1:32-436(-)